jgi:hypothetical protein
MSSDNGKHRSLGLPALRLAGGLCLALALAGAVSFIALRPQRRPPAEPAADEGGRAALVRPPPSWEAIDDPRRDGWHTEAFAAVATARLELLAAAIAGPEDLDAARRLEELAAPAFACGDLRRGPLEVVHEEGRLRVERAVAPPLPAAPLHRGPGGLGEALRGLGAPFRGASELRRKFKVFRVEARDETTLTRQYLDISGLTSQGFIEEHAVWTIRWGAAPEDPAPPRLLAIEVEELERVTRRGPRPIFSDCTASVLGGNPSYAGELLLGLNHWFGRLQETRFFALLGTPGLAVGDVNGDGLDDLYLCQEAGLPNRLFLQEPGGTAVEASAASGADWLESTRSALFIDLDNDGDQDLAAAVLGALVVAANDGRARFTVKAALPTSHDTMSLAAADYDLDGDLDIYVCAYKSDDLIKDAGVLSIGSSDDFVYHDANDAASNVLLRNDGSAGSWRFTDVTRETGLDANNRRYSFAAAWEDFDNDGDQDLYVANDFGRNNLYRNDLQESGSPRFTDVAGAAGAEDSASGMSVTWGDYDRDGRMDIYVSNMFSAAGSRITYQPLFKPGAAEEVIERLQRFARGNTLLRSSSTGAFEDASTAAAVTRGLWAWSSNFIDIDNDGWEDVVVANGYVTTDDPGDL